MRYEESKQTNGKRFEYVNKQQKIVKRYFGRVDFQFECLKGMTQ